MITVERLDAGLFEVYLVSLRPPRLCFKRGFPMSKRVQGVCTVVPTYVPRPD